MKARTLCNGCPVTGLEGFDRHKGQRARAWTWVRVPLAPLPGFLLTGLPALLDNCTGHMVNCTQHPAQLTPNNKETRKQGNKKTMKLTPTGRFTKKSLDKLMNSRLLPSQKAQKFMAVGLFTPGIDSQWLMRENKKYFGTSTMTISTLKSSIDKIREQRP